MGHKNKGLKKRRQSVDDEPEYLGCIEGGEKQAEHVDEDQPVLEHDEQVEEDQPVLEHDEEHHNVRGGTDEPVPSDHQTHPSSAEGESQMTQPPTKKHRGPTKMKDIAKDPNTRIRVEFTELGEPCGPGSVKLSSYLGPLVREHVPVLIDDWRKIGEERITVLWKSVQARFELDGEYEKAAVMKHMRCLWRASKSRLVNKIKSAKNFAARMKLRPKSISTVDWRKFVKMKTSPEFQVVSDQYKERRRNQIPHTCSRKGMVRLAKDLKKESSDPSNVTRLKVWVKSRTKKDGTAVNTTAADKIRKANELLQSDAPSGTSSNPKDDVLSQILGPDNPGRLRAMGRGMSMTKLACFQVKNTHVAEMQQNQAHLQQQVLDLQATLARLTNQRPEPKIGENSAPRSVNKRSHRRCLLFDWGRSDDKVAEGLVLSSDPQDFVNNIRLGPNSVKVLINTAIKADAFLWRPSPNMLTMEEAVGEIIAWPESVCVLIDKVDEQEDIMPKSPTVNSINKCKILDWSTNNEEVVAEGRWQSRDPKALVNGLPLGPNAVKVFVDVVMQPNTFLWRPTAELSTIEDCLKSFVSCPLDRVSFFGVDTETPIPLHPTDKSADTPPAPMKKPQADSRSPSESPSQRSQEVSPGPVVTENKKCLLMDISGNKRVVVEGRWSSNNPEVTVHFVPLGANAVRVWVDTVKVDHAPVWRPTSFIQCMEDAIGTTIAWPEDKVVLV